MTTSRHGQRLDLRSFETRSAGQHSSCELCWNNCWTGAMRCCWKSTNDVFWHMLYAQVCCVPVYNHAVVVKPSQPPHSQCYLVPADFCSLQSSGVWCGAQGRFYVGAGGYFPTQMWHKTLFDELRAPMGLIVGAKGAFCRLQNTVYAKICFSRRATDPIVRRWEGRPLGALPSYPTLLGASIWWGQCPKKYFV